MGFTTLKLVDPLSANLKELGFVKPTPIQAAAIPAILEGRDVVGLAQTGTGKTAAFALPMLQKLMGGPRKTRALIIGPTRELAEQTYQALRTLGKGTGLHAATIYGGVGMRPQIEALRHGTEIIVACPGRLLDHIRERHADLSAVEILVLDEADQMFDMGFLPDIKSILRALPAKRQTLLFSATMPDPIRKLATEILRNPVNIQIARVAPVETVTHALYPVAQHLKSPLLLELLRRTDTGPVLVFTRTKHRAKRLAQQLEREKFKATSLQGNLSQSQRQRAMDGFRSGQFNILVATDIAARGIDVADISHVINFDIPSTTDLYIHRIGRTGRAAKTGDAYTLVSQEDEADIRLIERALGQKIERRHLDGFDYKSAAPAKSAHPQPQGRHSHGQTRSHRPSRGGSGGGGHREGARSSGSASHAPSAAPASSSSAAPAPHGQPRGPKKGKIKDFWRRLSRST
jgi:ATP-dependent RNA helicase RhlE